MKFLKKEITIKRTVMGIIFSEVINGCLLALILYVFLTSINLNIIVEAIDKGGALKLVLITLPIIIIVCVVGGLFDALLQDKPSSKKKK